MMAPRKTYDHFYEWAGDYTREAMKGWGLGTLLILIAAGVVSYLAIQHGGPYIEAKTAKMRAEAEASTAVSAAVTKLTALAERGQEADERVKVEHKAFADAFAEANRMMSDAPAQREKANQLLQEMVEGMKATAEELRGFRKNDQAPPTTNDGGA